jgi:hypothetical protein
MPGVFDDKARWTVGFYILTFLLMLTSCATAPSSKTYVGPVSDVTSENHGPDSFQTLWEKWTVHFGTETGRRNLGFLSTPFSWGEGRGPGGSSEFPLYITATLMDSVLIEAGLQYFAKRIEMNQEEETTFRSRYFDRYDPTEHLLIWCELRTRFADNYLNLDRWIIYVEDDADNRFEPVRIMHELPSYRHTVMEKPLAFQAEAGLWGRETHSKRVMLCFPKSDFYGNPVRSKRVQFLKLIFQLIDDKSAKAEGKWMFKK